MNNITAPLVVWFVLSIAGAVAATISIWLGHKDYKQLQKNRERLHPATYHQLDLTSKRGQYSEYTRMYVHVVAVAIALLSVFVPALPGWLQVVTTWAFVAGVPASLGAASVISLIMRRRIDRVGQRDEEADGA